MGKPWKRYAKRAAKKSNNPFGNGPTPKRRRFGNGGNGPNGMRAREKIPSHPNNVFQGGYDITQYCQQFPVFRGFAKQDGKGKLTINFKSNASLLALAKFAIKSRLSLNINFALNGKFVPNVPFRMELICLVEDLIAKMQCRGTNGVIHGLEIETSSSAVYPILTAYRNHSWKILATESRGLAYRTGLQNIQANGIDNLTLKLVAPETYLFGVLEDEIIYDFCVHQVDYFKKNDAVTAFADTDPHGSNQGRGQLILPKKIRCSMKGGEALYVRKYINFTTMYKDRVRLFFIHIGRNSTTHKIRPILENLVGKDQMAIVPFHYGPSITYCIVWSFMKEISITDLCSNRITMTPKTLSSHRKKLQNFPMTFSSIDHLFVETTLKSCIERSTFLFDYLNISYETVRCDGNKCFMKLKAYKMTWEMPAYRLKKKLKVKKEPNNSDSSSSSDDENDKASVKEEQSSCVNENIICIDEVKDEVKDEEPEYGVDNDNDDDDDDDDDADDDIDDSANVDHLMDDPTKCNSNCKELVLETDLILRVGQGEKNSVVMMLCNTTASLNGALSHLMVWLKAMWYKDELRNHTS